MKAIRAVIKRAEFSEFTRLNVNYDLEVMLEAHKEALKPENFNYEDDDKIETLKETIKRQKEVNNIINAGFDFEKLNFENVAKKPTRSGGMSLTDVMLQKVANGE